jgi:hypothetical protein
MAIKRKSKQPNSPPSGAPWIWQTADILASPAWRAMSINARRALDRIMLEHMAHAGTENGNLLVTHRQFIEAGVSRDYVADAIDELEHLRLIRVTVRGRGGIGSHHANRFLLTWMPERGSRFCDDPWTRTDEGRVQAWQQARKALKRKRQRSTQTKSRDGVKNHFPTPQTRTRALRIPGVERRETGLKDLCGGQSSTPHSRSTINILPGYPAPADEGLGHIAELVPGGWRKPTAQSRPGTGNTTVQLRKQNDPQDNSGLEGAA